jgi:hypothetical protein
MPHELHRLMKSISELDKEACQLLREDLHGLNHEEMGSELKSERNDLEDMEEQVRDLPKGNLREL